MTVSERLGTEEVSRSAQLSTAGLRCVALFCPHLAPSPPRPFIFALVFSLPRLRSKMAEADLDSLKRQLRDLSLKTDDMHEDIRELRSLIQRTHNGRQEDSPWVDPVDRRWDRRDHYANPRDGSPERRPLTRREDRDHRSYRRDNLRRDDLQRDELRRDNLLRDELLRNELLRNDLLRSDLLRDDRQRDDRRQGDRFPLVGTEGLSGGAGPLSPLGVLDVTPEVANLRPPADATDNAYGEVERPHDDEDQRRGEDDDNSSERDDGNDDDGDDDEGNDDDDGDVGDDDDGDVGDDDDGDVGDDDNGDGDDDDGDDDGDDDDGDDDGDDNDSYEEDDSW